MKPITKNKAAAEVRHKILRKMTELESEQGSDYVERWEKLRVYIKGMAGRASSKKGGLGRK